MQLTSTPSVPIYSSFERFVFVSMSMSMSKEMTMNLDTYIKHIHQILYFGMEGVNTNWKLEKVRRSNSFYNFDHLDRIQSE
jgi:hypothetical protein